MQWLSENHQVLRLAISFVLLIIWLTYLQVFLASYLQQRRPMILINRTGASNLRARCLVSNMSSEAIYVESIIVRLFGSGKSLTCTATDLDDLNEEQLRSDPKSSTRQGPLGSGEYMDIGDFAALLERLARENGRSGDTQSLLAEGDRLEILVVAAYGSARTLVAARRCFDVVDKERLLRPQGLTTEQITGRRQRRQIEALLKERL